jgi:hypothetical protein
LQVYGLKVDHNKNYSRAKYNVCMMCIYLVNWFQKVENKRDNVGRREHKSPTPILIRVHIENFLVVTKGGDTRTNLINIYFPSKIVIEILYIPMYIYIPTILTTMKKNCSIWKTSFKINILDLTQ